MLHAIICLCRRCLYTFWHFHSYILNILHFTYVIITTDTSDFIPFSTTDRTVTATNDIDIRLFSRNDGITLEYNDTVILRFTTNPGLAALIQQLEAAGEYIRDTAIVDIIDNDRK